MKHILIILSILLLSSPLFGQSNYNYDGSSIKKKGTGTILYLWDTSVGQVWGSFGDEDVQPIYKGKRKDGKPHGLGIMYNGYLKIGGRINFRPGWTFNGEWKNGKIHGEGTLRYKWKDGKFSEWIGQFKEGRRWNTQYIYDGSLGPRFVNGKKQK